MLSRISCHRPYLARPAGITMAGAEDTANQLGATADFSSIQTVLCPAYEGPSQCAVRLAREGDFQSLAIDGLRGVAYCGGCSMEFLIDRYQVSHQQKKTDEGVETFGSILSKSGKQRNREQSVDRLAYLCSSKLNLSQNALAQARLYLFNMMEAGAAKGGRGFPQLEVVAAYVAGRMDNQSLTLEYVVDIHRDWITEEGDFKSIKMASMKSVNRLLQKMTREKILPYPRPSADDIIGSNSWCLANLDEDVLRLAKEIANSGAQGSPDSIAAASVMLATKDKRVIKPGDVISRPRALMAGEADGQRLTLESVVKLFPGTTARTVRRRMKEIREIMEINLPLTKAQVEVLENPDPRKQRVRETVAQVFSEMDSQLGEKIPFTSKDVSILRKLKKLD